MEKKDIIVPKGIRYISDWEGYSLSNYNFPHILNKVLTGCGFTEYCLRSNQNVILCSPRRMLLENKEDQHPGEIYYARNDIYDAVNYDRSLEERDLIRGAGKGTIFKSSEQRRAEEEARLKAQEETRKKISKFKNDVINYYYSTGLKPCKIIVTYDSLKHVKEALEQEGVLDKFQVVIDEFQSILVDVKFKTDTELDLLYQLKDLKRVCFVSATPMLDKYLDRLDEFKNLPYYRFDWETEDPSRIINPNLNVRVTESIFKDVVKVINNYKEGKFERSSWIDSDTGKISEIVSKEAVLYMNAVKTICSMIVKCELTPDNTNVLCARTDENEEKVRKAFNDSLKKQGLTRIPKGTKVIGTIPKKGEPHKMFTFCTRTVYLGADFYSTNARTFVFSDSNIDCLSVDISMDLPQILGRQRLTENPWKNSAEVFIKSTIVYLTKEDFEKKLQEKTKVTENLLKVYSQAEDALKFDLANQYQKGVKASLYKDDYLAVNQHEAKTLMPVFNKLMLVAEQRAFDIQQVDYKDRVSVFNTLKSKGFLVTEIEKQLERFNQISYYQDKMRFVCEMGIELEPNKFDLFLNSIPISFKNYYIVLGPEKCKACKYQKGEMEKEYQKLLGNQGIDIGQILLDNFNVGDRYSNVAAKEKLKTIYEKVGYKKFPLAIDLNEVFITKACKVNNPKTKKRENGIEIVGKK